MLQAPVLPREIDFVEQEPAAAAQEIVECGTTAVVGYDPEKSLISALNVDRNNETIVGKIRRFPTVIGHRGSLYKAVENTRHGFLTAATIDGAAGIELDAFLLKCGTLVAFHGSTDEGNLEHYFTNVASGTILEYTAQEVREFKFNHRFEEFPESTNIREDAGDKYYIPLLEDVLLDLKPTGIKVKIELKGPNTAEPVLEMVERLDMVDQCDFNSFILSKIKRIRELRPDKNVDGSYRYRTGALFNDVPDNFIELAQEAGACEINLRYENCTSDRVRAIHAAGMNSMLWIHGPLKLNRDIRERFHDVWSEDERMYRILMSSGVQGMCVNKPWLLVGMLKKAAHELLQEVTDMKLVS